MGEREKIFCPSAPLPLPHRICTHRAQGICTKSLFSNSRGFFLSQQPTLNLHQFTRALAEPLPPTSVCLCEHRFVPPAGRHLLSVGFPLVPISAASDGFRDRHGFELVPAFFQRKVPLLPDLRILDEAQFGIFLQLMFILDLQA